MHSIAASLIAFTATATVLTMTPGLDTALVLRTAASEGSRPAALAGLGIATGCFIWAAIVAAGLGVLLEASHLAYTILRWVGAGYLIWTGYRMLRYPRSAALAPGVTNEPGAGAGHAAFVRGALTNLLNPKVGIFYVSFLPQFVPNDMPVAPYTMLLGAIHALLGIIWFLSLILATRPLSNFLRRATVVRTLDRTTGGIFMAFGAGLALESSRS